MRIASLVQVEPHYRSDERLFGKRLKKAVKKNRSSGRFFSRTTPVRTQSG